MLIPTYVETSRFGKGHFGLDFLLYEIFSIAYKQVFLAEKRVLAAYVQVLGEAFGA